MNKIISYVGFAIKANKIIIGQSSVKSAKEKIYLIMLSSLASENLINLANNVANKQKCKLIILDNLEEITNLKDVKIIAITDENLSNAIIKEKENNIG